MDVKATLQVANGDRAKALKMLEDPDALMANPDIKRIIAEGAGESALEVVEGQYPEGEAAADGAAAAATATAGGEAVADAGKVEGRGRQQQGSNTVEEKKEEVVEKEATDEDPREHLNIVFIGHGACAGGMLLCPLSYVFLFVMYDGAWRVLNFHFRGVFFSFLSSAICHLLQLRMSATIASCFGVCCTDHTIPYHTREATAAPLVRSCYIHTDRVGW